MTVEVPRLIEKLRATFGKDTGVLTRRTGWTFVWDVRRSKVTVTEGKGGATWSQKVGELPPNVQEEDLRGVFKDVSWFWVWAMGERGG